jgi:hypothetical protein
MSKLVPWEAGISGIAFTRPDGVHVVADATIDTPEVLEAIEQLSFEDRVKLARQLEVAYAKPRTQPREPALFRPVRLRPEDREVVLRGGPRKVRPRDGRGVVATRPIPEAGTGPRSRGERGNIQNVTREIFDEVEDQRALGRQLTVNGSKTLLHPEEDPWSLRARSQDRARILLEP